MPRELLSCAFFGTVRDKVATLNLFDSKSTDPLIIHRQIWSTRLYITLVLLALILLTTYSSVRNQNEQRTVQTPSEALYSDLQKKYASSLQCACTKVSITYSKFVRLIPRFHQVCSSRFISQPWIDFLFQINFHALLPIDIRTSISAMWQLIRTLCHSSTNATEDALIQFLNSSLISSTLLTDQLVRVKIQTALRFLRQQTAANLLQSITLAQQMTRTNQFVSGLSTNYRVVIERSSLTPTSVFRLPNIYGNIYITNHSREACSCQTNDSCPLPGNLYLFNNSKRVAIYDLTRIEVNASLPGLVVDCLPIQTTLASSFECFYNQSCLNILLSSYLNPIDISLLNQSNPSRFPPSTNISQLISELFLEEIHLEINYSDYYSQCSPRLCTYLHFHRLHWLALLTTFIGLLGGMIAVLRLVTLLITEIVFFVKRQFCSEQSHDEQRLPNSNCKCGTYLKNTFINVISKVISLSFFDNHSGDRRRVYRGILATRLYLSLLIISIWILILFSDLSDELITDKLSSPTQKDYEKLEEDYPSNLVCPCTEISIPYRQIINIEVKLHQVCSSDFVQPSWYQHLLFPNVSNEKLDFLAFASSYFQTLTTFCRFANLTLADAIERFLSRNFLQSQLASKHLFHAQINSDINTFIQQIKVEFRSRLAFTSAIMHSNQYHSRMKTSTSLRGVFEIQPNHVYNERMAIVPVYTFSSDGKRCYCVLNSTCTVTLLSTSENSITNFNGQLAGIHGGCSVISSVLKSSLLCWFEKACLKQLDMLLRAVGGTLPQFVTSLDPGLSSRYQPNASIESIVDELMIEQWHWSDSFEAFFRQCQPTFCSFTYEKKINVIYLIAVVISFIGGISTVLKLISPFLVKIIFVIIDHFERHRSVASTQQEDPGTGRTCGGIFHMLDGWLKKLLMYNVFNSESADERIVRRERISTKIYWLIFLICIYSVTIYTISAGRTEVKAFVSFSQTDQNQSLECPCKKIFIEYKAFVQMKTRFHRVCTSDFVQIAWREFLFGDSDWNVHARRDIRVRGSMYFSFLSTLCDISQTTVENAIDQFLNETFVSTHLISQSEVETEVKGIISQFQKSTVGRFAQTLKLLRGLFDGNALVSSYQLNWYWQREFNQNVDHVFAYPIRISDNCTCGTRNDCSERGAIFNGLVINGVFEVPGWTVGCSVVETLLRSTLECFFHQVCIETILERLKQNANGFDKPMKISALSSLHLSRFQTTTTIENIANELFLEDWQYHIAYSSYRNHCAPASCSYQLVRDDYLIYTFSKVLGLYGGLRIVLRFVIPLLVTVAFSMRSRCRTNIVTPVR